MKHKFLTSLLEVTKTEVTFNREQLKLYRSGELSLDQVWMLNNLDKEIASLSDRAYSMLVGIVAMLLGAMKVNNIELFIGGEIACFNPLNQIDKLGGTFLEIFKSIGYWVCIIFCFIDIIKTVMKGGKGTQDIFAVIFKNILIFASLYLVPFFFDMIKGAF